MYKQVFDSWKDSKFISNADREELLSLTDEKDIEYRFGKYLEFGTAGMRGLIGLGTNMMNEYMVKYATQGLAEYINAQGEDAAKRGVVISFDTRRKSKEFAYYSALVLATNGIKVYLFDQVHPVPMLSYAVKKLKTFAGIMITASHNPKEYNGYKVYGEDGAQMSPEATEKVVKYMEMIGTPISDKILCDEKFEKKIKSVPRCVDKTYYKIVRGLSLSKKQVKEVGKTIKLIYTPLHGSGYIPVTTVLKKMGINATLVPEQVNPDTEFSTVQVPNPENKEALTLGIKMADFKNADVVFGTDPDCDRLGVAIRDDKGEFKALSGNQIGVLLLDYVLTRAKESGEDLSKGFVVKSFVSTGLAKLIASGYGVELFETPVGFKFIGEKIKEYDDTGKKKFMFGFEESCGYLRGTHCRDKDAVVASMLFAEMVCYYTANGVGVYERLMQIYEKYGFVFDTTVAVQYSGLNAMKEMNAVVDKMKTEKVESIGDIKVLATRDYSANKKTLSDGRIEELGVPKNNAVYYELEGGSFVCLRPSGTEPKLKVYYSVKAENEESARSLFNKVKADFENLIK